MKYIYNFFWGGEALLLPRNTSQNTHHYCLIVNNLYDIYGYFKTNMKELVVYIDLDLEPLDLLNSLALSCYPPSPELLISLYMPHIILLLRVSFL